MSMFETQQIIDAATSRGLTLMSMVATEGDDDAIVICNLRGDAEKRPLADAIAALAQRQLQQVKITYEARFDDFMLTVHLGRATEIVHG